MPGSIGPATFDAWEVADPAGGPDPIISSPICLLPMVDANIWYLFRLYRHYKNGVLLSAGGIMDQPNRYIETMELIEDALNNG